MSDSIRSFIAVELPPEVRQGIGRIQAQLKDRGVAARWVKPDNIHLTMRFLGDIAAARIDPVGLAMKQAAADIAPFRLRAHGMGVFPGLRKARVLWVGVGGDVASLASMHRRLAAELEKIDFDKESRPFRAHLTIGRFKGRVDPARLAGAVEALDDYGSEFFSVSRLILFESRLKPSGAVYKRLIQAPLTTPGPDPGAAENGRMT